MSSSVTAPSQAVDLRAAATTLKAQLRHRRWMERAKAIGLIAPLFLFLLIIFVVPIGLLLTRGIDNGDAALILPRTHDVLVTWPGDVLPPDDAFDALGADFKNSPRDAVAELAKRLNYYQPGLRSVILSTSRALRRVDGPPYKDAFLEADASWGELSTWRAIKRTLPAYTDFYLLAAMDLQRDDQGDIVAAPAESAVYRDVLVRTFVISLSVTLICLLLGYPLAYLIATAPSRTANILLLFVLLPFWTSLLVRTTAWVVLLQSNGVVNSLLAWLGVTGPEGFTMIYNRVGVLIAMTHILLPFMVLPIYSVMKGISPVYTRAASSLGAPPSSAFWRVYMPLTLPGVSAGCLLVFILALGYYITPALVGGPHDQMVSYFIAYFASQVTNWGMAAALSAILLGIVLLLYMVYNRLVGLDQLRIG